MKCKLCNLKAVYGGLCKEHFISYFEKKVKKTITKYNLISKKDKVVIAMSGGKDSLTAAYLVNKFFGNITALSIDEGISGYRNKTLIDLKKFCTDNNIPLKIFSFKDEFGMPLDTMVKKTKFKPCHICGILRRYMLNKHSKGFDRIVTGHNLDDEAQSVLVNLFRANHELMARLGPSTGLKKNKNFTQRVKPLYLCKEKEVMVYTILMGFDVNFTECKYAGHSYRSSVRDLLNDYEFKHPGTKQNTIEHFLSILPSLKKKFATSKEPKICKCGEPTNNEICKTCDLLINHLPSKSIKP